jgi:hypothetical protein
MEILSPAAPASETPKDHDNLERAPTAVAAGELSPRSSAAMGEVAATNNWEAEFDKRFGCDGRTWIPSLAVRDAVKAFIRNVVLEGEPNERSNEAAEVHCVRGKEIHSEIRGERASSVRPLSGDGNRAKAEQGTKAMSDRNWDWSDLPIELASQSHGHVSKRPDGLLARCGGPGICPVCQRELDYFKQLDNYRRGGAKP